LAQENLMHQGYVVYLPRLLLMCKRQGRQVAVIEPLFPRYLFIHLNTQSDNWGPIRSILGVASLVRFGSEPAKVPDGFIAHPKAHEGLKGLHEWAAPKVTVGDRLRVAEGSLKGYEGILLAKSGAARVMLLLDILGKEVRAHLSLGQIESANR
jgi:transcriptional antiterminator RfaH